MINFDDNYHLHVGYYEDGYDLEAVFFKVKDEDKWCMFFDNDSYNILFNDKHYQRYEDFGLLINQYQIKEEDMTYEYGSLIFEKF